MEDFLKLFKKHYGIILFLTLYFGILSFKVISHPTPFYDWDESIYAQVGKEMIQQKSIIPLYQGEPWLEKPPLAPVFYGLIQLLPMNPDISTRLASIQLSLCALLLIYRWGIKVKKNLLFALVVTIFTAFNPVFFQRSQIVNTDVFLIIGWLGYLLYFEKFWISFLFLFIGVMSKSLLGFYPAILMVIYETYQFIVKKDSQRFIKNLQKIMTQILILLTWYLFMILIFKKTFIQVHFSEHLIKRVTKSIESHFGQRTFYLDAVFKEYGWFSFVTFFSVGLLTIQFLKQRLKSFEYFLGLSIIPWFIFLNLTKTKIEWYIYPFIPGLAFLLLYPLTLLKNSKLLFYLVSALLVVIYLIYSFPTLYNASYSSYDENYKLAVAAKDSCGSLTLLVDKNDRKTHDVLQGLNLLISTSDIYGSHPAVIYYYGKKVLPVYSEQIFVEHLNHLSTNECTALDEKDLHFLPTESMNNTATTPLMKIGKFGTFYLYKRV